VSNSISQIFRLESVSKVSEAVPVTFGVKTTPEEERADLQELEMAYINDPIVNRGINNVVSVIMSGDYELVGSEKSVSATQEFLDQIGTKGGNTEWSRLLELTFKHQCVYGRAFNEIIYNAKKDDVLDLDFIDPKKMDYAKSNFGKLVLNKFSNSVGWVETVPYAEMIEFDKLRTDGPPSEVHMESNKIFFAPDRIAHYKLYEIGDGFYGLGLVEPILKVSKWKRTMMEALTNVYFRAGFPRNVYKVGDQFHEPTNELLQKTAKQLEKSSYKNAFAIPNYVDPLIVESKKSDKLREHLKQFIDEEVAVLGPKAFVTGLGEGTNKATMTRLEFIYKLTLKDIVTRTTNTIERQIFSKIAKLNNLPDVPKIRWGEINLEELDSKSKRIIGYVGSGLIRPDKAIEEFIRKSEGLPEALEADNNGTKEE